MSVSLALTSRNVHRTINRTSRHYAGALPERPIQLPEVERRLRRPIDEHFKCEEIAAIVDPADAKRSVASASDLTIGESARLLEEPSRWSRLGWGLDRAVFIAELHDIRLIRNEIMYFSLDPLDDEQVRKIELFLRLLRRLDPQLDL